MAEPRSSRVLKKFLKCKSFPVFNLGFVRQILAQWRDPKLASFKFDSTELRQTPSGDPLDKVGLLIEHMNKVASFTAWGEQGTSEWLVRNVQSGEIIVNRDETFTDENELIEIVERAMLDLC